MIKRRALRILLFLGGAAVVIGAPIAYKSWDYIQNDPNFCTSCHLMDEAFDRWSESGHKDVNCHTCHPGDIQSNLHQLWVTFTQHPDQVKKHADVPAKICADCHLSNDERWKQIADTAGHKLHHIEKGIECVACHAAEIHKFRPTDAMCKGCHYDQVIALTPMQRNHCTTCHQFLAPASAGLGPNRATCGQCHAQGLDGAPALDSGWHSGMECADCHPVHDPVGPAGDAPVRDGAARPCLDCHDDVAEASPVSDGHDQCTDCHVPHSAESATLRCRTCHQAQDRSAELARAGTRRPSDPADLPLEAPHQCTDCHVAHAPDVRPAEQCAECHRDEPSLARETPVPEHRECAACHDPHAPGAPDAPACAGCHADVARLTRGAGPAAHRQCAGCHKVHAPESPRRCASCHEYPVAADAPPEHQRCDTCHRAHGSPLAGDATCTKCHAPALAEAALGAPEHGRCGECHSAHDPTPIPRTSCASCHAPQAASMEGEPLEHQDCATCHPRHDRRPPATAILCGGCHNARIPTGGTPPGHADCTSCHSPHRVDAGQSCADCHAAQAAGVRTAGLPDHQACGRCHASHGAPRTGPAACGQCHEEQTARGLHAVPEHRDCGRCHGAHPPEPAPARVCLECHDTRKLLRHPPEARGVTTCSGCHNFREGGAKP